jgi:hypothetical protein
VAKAYLGENQAAAVPHDEVDFTNATAIVGRNVL